MDMALQAILSVIGVYGAYQTGEKKLTGWLLSILYQVLWILYATLTGQYFFILVCLVYVWVYAKAYKSWREDALHQQRSDVAVENAVQVPLADAE
jgi:hypothetical protein